MTETLSQTPPELFPARGNQVVKKIIEYPNQGVVIQWVNPELQPTNIFSEGFEIPIFDQIKKLYPDLSTASGSTLTIITDKYGQAISLGKQGEEQISIEESLREAGIPIEY